MDVGGHQDGSTCLVFVLLLSHFLSGSDPSGGWWNHGATWQGWTMDPFWTENRKCGPLWAARALGVVLLSLQAPLRSGSIAELQPESTAKTHPVDRSLGGKKTVGVKLALPPLLAEGGPVTRNCGTGPRLRVWTCVQPGDPGGAPCDSESVGKPHEGANRRAGAGHPNSMRGVIKVLDSKPPTMERAEEAQGRFCQLNSHLHRCPCPGLACGAGRTTQMTCSGWKTKQTLNSHPRAATLTNGVDHWSKWTSEHCPD